MSLPHARKITVDGIKYQWIVKGSSRKFAGFSPKYITLIVLKKDTNSLMIADLFSKNWDEELMGDRSYKEHKASFTPKDVADCIKSAIINGWDINNKSKYLLKDIPELKDYGKC